MTGALASSSQAPLLIKLGFRGRKESLEVNPAYKHTARDFVIVNAKGKFWSKITWQSREICILLAPLF